MTTQQIIKKLRKEGLKTPQIAKILKATNIRAYENGKPINWRIEERINVNYFIYLKGKEVDKMVLSIN